MIGFLLIFCLSFFFLHLFSYIFSRIYFVVYRRPLVCFLMYIHTHAHTSIEHSAFERENYLSLNWFQHFYYKRSDVCMCWFATRPVICCTLIVYNSCFISFRAPKYLIGFMWKQGSRMWKKIAKWYATFNMCIIFFICLFLF